ncbi:MAG: hypothetical protein GXO74_00230 [Calditrichaeota bacterium]|nr:hypothetical protein [Calditrichota bacterium]
MKTRFFIFLLIVSFFACSKKKEESKQVIVSVGNEKLTWGMLSREIPDNLKGKMSHEEVGIYIQQWIDQELLYQAAVKMGMDLDADYFQELEKMKKELLVRKFLESYLLTKDAQVSEDEALAFYQKNKDTFIVPKTEIHALHILAPTIEIANQALKRIGAGEDFEKVARDLSVDYRDRGRIDLGYFNKDDVVREVANKVFSYRVGSVTRPIKSEFGYHIFKILARRERGTFRKFDDVKNQIYERLRAGKKKQAYRSLISDLRQKIAVEKNESFINQMYGDSAAAKKMP